MKITTHIRPPYVAYVLILLIAIASCKETIETTNVNTFDHEAFNLFKQKLDQIQAIQFNEDTSPLDKQKQLLFQINNQFGTDLTFDDRVFELAGSNPDKIFEVALNNKWMSQSDIEETQLFILEAESFGFEEAINSFEQRALSQNLPLSEFNKRNAFSNIMRSLHFANPDLYPSSTTQDITSDISSTNSWWRCALAVTALTAATASMVSCATVAACIFAIALFHNATLGVAEQCGKDESKTA
ncbi:hypothetical protein BXY85_3897 [Roseivirga pacifica]|uniref:Uncharacterized protein n=1 Tax=Roseivirga pacifica TaxID=1267423 RepID=A0A1I0Q3K6_9BACT|nr:hypothetical protein [Roseivirga pacifica]RKQ43278.1 hypothetical protein BXY85_3897 [Roseivirga pacifica]SEW21468.1 hypothetical protein SAMN05216290_1978 [Roseivirga pacifica]